MDNTRFLYSKVTIMKVLRIESYLNGDAVNIQVFCILNLEWLTHFTLFQVHKSQCTLRDMR